MSVKMLIPLLFLIAVPSIVNGYSFKASNPHPNANYFRDSRIVGGVVAPPGYGKHMAALLYGYRWVSFICGGSIITQRHILTAAHCIDVMLTWNKELEKSFRALIGTDTWATGDNEREFSSYVVHSGWDWNTIKNDIGILNVSRDIRPSPTVAYMPLNFDIVPGGVPSYVTGWGLHADMNALPEKLQILDVRTLSFEECQERYRVASQTEGPMPEISKKLEICALHSVGHGMCNGDSGSALIRKDNKQQIGIVSWGVACAKGFPDVYARISGFTPWILYHTDGLLS